MSRSTTPPVVVTDLDGTLVNVMDEVIAEIHRIFGVALTPEDCNEYSVPDSFYPELSAHFRDVDALNHFLIRNFWCNAALMFHARPYWNLWQALQVFQAHGGVIVGLTSRAGADDILAVTHTWLRQWGFPKVECIFTHESPDNRGLSGPEAKLADIKRLGLRYPGDIWFIEDHPGIAGTVHHAGLDHVTVYMVERPWTKQAFGHKSVPRRYIIQDLADVIDDMRSSNA